MKENNSPKGSLTWLTGRSGSGKSTLARMMQDDYDVVVGADTGFFDPGIGKWHEPTPEEKKEIRENRAKLIQESINEGKNVLFEGAPGVAIKYPESLLRSIQQIVALDANKSDLLKNVINRSKMRGSYYSKEGRKDDLDNFHRLYQNFDETLGQIRNLTDAPIEWKKMDYQKTAAEKKSLTHAEQRMQERAPGNEESLNQIRHALKTAPLQKKKTYSIPLPQGQGYVVVGDIGKKHVVKTVLGPEMRPPGEILRLLEQEKKASVEVDRLISLFLRGVIKP